MDGFQPEYLFWQEKCDRLFQPLISFTRYAKEKGYEIIYFPADWEKHGKAAGAIRNEEMAKADANALALFWDGKSKGSLNMLNIAKKYNLDIKICRF